MMSIELEYHEIGYLKSILCYLKEIVCICLIQYPMWQAITNLVFFLMATRIVLLKIHSHIYSILLQFYKSKSKIILLFYDCELNYKCTPNQFVPALYGAYYKIKY